MAPELDIAPSRFEQMEAYEATRIVYSRVQAVDPENASKIMGYLLLQDQGEHQIFCLAMGPDALLHSAIANARLHLGLIKSGALNLSDLNIGNSSNSSSSSISSTSQEHLYICNQMLQHANLKLASNNIQQPDGVLQRGPAPGPWSFQQQPNSSCSAASPRSSFSGGVFPNDHFYPETFAFLNSSKMKAEKSGGGWPLSHDEISSEIGSSSSCCKPCVYYSRGFCRHGSSCRFLHNNFSQSSTNSGHSSPDSNSLADHSDESGGGGGTNGSSELGSLERLEVELQELLASRKAPVSIAALPQLYYEKFGRPLQAEGYLTESQRHGKSGYNLTRLLSKLRESIT